MKYPSLHCSKVTAKTCQFFGFIGAAHFPSVNRMNNFELDKFWSPNVFLQEFRCPKCKRCAAPQIHYSWLKHWEPLYTMYVYGYSTCLSRGTTHHRHTGKLAKDAHLSGSRYGQVLFLWYQRGLPGAIKVVSLAPNLGVSLKKSLTAMMFTTF